MNTIEFVKGLARKSMIGASVAIAVAVGVGSVAWAQARNEQPTIPLNLQGKSTLQVVPDTLEATISLQSNQPSGSEATNHVTTMMQKVIDALNAAGVRKGDVSTGTINSNGYGCDPTGGVSAPEQVSPDYCRRHQLGNAYATITIRIHDMAKAGSILSAVMAIDSDPNDQDSVSLSAGNFTVTNKESVEQKAQALAVANARAQAQGIAKASGRRLGKLTNLVVVGAPYVDPIPLSDSLRGKLGAPSIDTSAQSIPVEPGNTDVTAIVNVTYELK